MSSFMRPSTNKRPRQQAQPSTSSSWDSFDASQHPSLPKKLKRTDSNQDTKVLTPATAKPKEDPLTEEQQKILDVSKPPPDVSFGDMLDIVSSTPPTEKKKTRTEGPFIVRVTAAAGTGKTRTVIDLIYCLEERGHESIQYITYNRAAAHDCGKRMLEAKEAKDLQSGRDPNQSAIVSDVLVGTQTAHSMVFQILRPGIDLEERDEDGNLVQPDDETPLLETDQQIIDFVHRACSGELDEFMIQVPQGKTRRQARRVICENIIATFDMFLHSAETDVDVGLSLDKYYRCTHWKCKSWHNHKTKPLPKGVPKDYKSFYVRAARKLWSLVLSGRMLTYDSLVKQALIGKMRVAVRRPFRSGGDDDGDLESTISKNATALLLDESQDLDACQMALFELQATEYGTHVYFVGDPAQTIYSFRGAASRNLMGIQGCVDLSLTRSFRFGPGIAAAANLILFAKEMSPQTISSKSRRRRRGAPPPVKSWRPYRVIGVGGKGAYGTVTSTSMVDAMVDDKKNKIPGGEEEEVDSWFKSSSDVQSIIDDTEDGDGGGGSNARVNESKGSSPSSSSSSFLRQGPVTVLARTNKVLFFRAVDLIIGPDIALAASKAAMADTTVSEDTFSGLTVAVNGETTDVWDDFLDPALAFGKLLTGQADTLPFPEWKGETGLTWDAVKKDIDALDMRRFKSAVEILEMYQGHTVFVVETVKRVVFAHIPASQEEKDQAQDPTQQRQHTDVLLSTIHAAKGLEWDRVEVMDDLCELSCFKGVLALTYASGSAEYCIQDAMFDFKSKNDDINLWYVAFTRARKVLCVPPKFVALMSDLENIRAYVEEGQGDELRVVGGGAELPQASTYDPESIPVLQVRCRGEDQKDFELQELALHQHLARHMFTNAIFQSLYQKIVSEENSMPTIVE